ncbi:hypothetical protein AVEN_160131-1 [Araneus ventricosus]|uniref:Uncharacterized protein n=1 Tax=Araneus ventricosus TaxID=182803 RepID=A0A4Y2TR97_ARAVE|nr:hypothetical protein AVEN_160131-1 [Araneus ventricosus]
MESSSRFKLLSSPNTDIEKRIAFSAIFDLSPRSPNWSPSCENSRQVCRRSHESRPGRCQSPHAYPSPLKPAVLGRKPHELDSPNLGGHFHQPISCYNLPLRLREMSCGLQGYLDPLPSSSPKNLTSPKKQPTASDWPSSLRKGKCLDLPGPPRYV